MRFVNQNRLVERIFLVSFYEISLCGDWGDFGWYRLHYNLPKDTCKVSHLYEDGSVSWNSPFRKILYHILGTGNLAFFHAFLCVLWTLKACRRTSYSFHRGTCNYFHGSTCEIGAELSSEISCYSQVQDSWTPFSFYCDSLCARRVFVGFWKFCGSLSCSICTYL